MIIGIDIDGVLCNYGQFLIDTGSEICSKHKKYHLQNPYAYGLLKMFNGDEKFADIYREKYEADRLSAPAFLFASEVINKLKKDGHQIYIITHRNTGDEWFPKNLQPKVEEFTIDWLKKNNISFDKIFFKAFDKGEICKENGVEIMVEDAPENLRMLRGKTTPFVYDARYNSLPELDDLTRVYSWYDVYEKVQNYQKNIKK